MQRLLGLRFALTLIPATLATPAAFAHARWVLTGGALKPRTDSSGLKEPAPCGGAAVNESRRAELTAGESLELKWEETVNHPGHYRIAFSPDGVTGFDDNIIQDNIEDTQDDANVPHQYSLTITVPDIECDKCAFQLIQVMTENPAAPRNYNSCADVKIVKGGATTTDTSTATGTDAEPEPTGTPAAPQNLKIEVKKVTS